MKPPKRVSRIYRDNSPDFSSGLLTGETLSELSSRPGVKKEKKKPVTHARVIFEISKGSIPRDNLGRYFSGLIPLWHDKNVISIDHRRPFPSVLPRALSRS